MRRVLISTKPFIFVLFLVGVTVRSAESLSSAIPQGTSTKRANSKRANHGRSRLFQDADDFVAISPFLYERIGTLCRHPCWSLCEQRIAGWRSGRSDGYCKSLSAGHAPTDLLLLTQRTSRPVPGSPPSSLPSTVEWPGGTRAFPRWRERSRCTCAHETLPLGGTVRISRPRPVS